MLSTISRRLVFGAASALLFGTLVAAAPSGPPAAHLVSEKQMPLRASDTSLLAVDAARIAAAVPPPTLVAVGDIACPPGSTPTTTTCRQGAAAALAPPLETTRGRH